jgi:NAD(P)-dependent dehydrogenase (short-subunit alcohol dehydrogenase family)
VKNIAEQVALVTGAGSGIGRATALELAECGARVAVTDIDAPGAESTAREIEAAGGVAKFFQLDVSDAGQIARVADSVHESLGDPSILVNNAGIAVGGEFLDTSESSWSTIVSINLMGVVNCSRMFIPRMVASGKPGHVVNIASMLGYTAARGVSAYCATKFGVVGFSECIRAELAAQNVGVSVICPGVVRTNIINAGILESDDPDIEEKRETIQAFYERRNYPPERVAKAVVRAIRKNRAMVPVTPEAWLSWYLKRLSPSLARLIALRELA